MRDLLVPLAANAALEATRSDSQVKNCIVRGARPRERDRLCAWVARAFGPAWYSECRHSFDTTTPRCLVAWRIDAPVGFACYDAVALGVLGPLGVDTDSRSLGIGRALVIETLRTMRNAGYAYAVVGAVGSGTIAFYERVANAIVIDGSEERARLRAISHTLLSTQRRQ